ncbi:MAG TPA: DNA polymerase III subunit alpha [Ktedonobacterales bacterium]|nr:DNA polymerase III subunit alpha [Ktedonobacterales bacterium]
MGANEFTHLHVHSEYSLLDGLSRVKDLVSQAKSYGMQHLAITDHGAMYGAIDFYKACKAAEINPIIGVESYLTPNAIEDHSGKYDYFHLLLLAQNATGYQNLLKLTTLAHTKGYHLRPRIDKKTLAEHAEGLIATSTCISGEIPSLLLKGDLNGARQVINWYREVFGPDHFFLELQDHQAAESEQGRVNQMLYDLHKETGLPLVATNDLHYVRAEDAQTQDVLLCVQTGKNIDDPKRMKFDSQHYYLKSADEMAALFGDVPDALKNTMRIAEMCQIDVQFGQALLPNFPIPIGYKSPDDYLYQLCLSGVEERYGKMTDEIKDRLNYEFDIISQKGFVSYFLIVWDFYNEARKRGIRCSARGSAAGSLIGYVLGITSVDPLQYRLLFERFLNPERKSMPDIDTDFPDDRREEMVVYVAEKYGWDKVAQIVTFNTMAAKAAVRDVGRVLSLQNEADTIARLIPTGPKVTLRGSMETIKDLQQRYDGSETTRTILDKALALEGTIRSTGIHAAGVVISREPLVDVLPLQLRDPKDLKSWLVSQYEQGYLEELGLLKFDFLGLSNLTILQNSVKFIKETRGIELDLDHIPTDDQKAYDLLSSGETTGIFQLESGAMRQHIKELKPTSIEDLTAMVALYRPGPMESIPTFIKAKHGDIQIKYLHPDLEPFLKESYGVLVYQDQVLYIAVNLAGFTWGEVDTFRKAMGKKIPEELLKYRSKFIEGCVKHGIDRKIADEIFTLIEPFGGYGFNKAHACSYAWVAYMTAYLKANYTPEFMAATLTTEASDAKKVMAAVAECRRMGVEVLPPNINKSDIGFTVEDGKIRFGLLAIKNVGSRPIEEILANRQREGRFVSLADLCARVDSRAVTRSALECLIKVGALDELGPRHQLLESLDHAISIGQQQRKMAEIGQGSLFGGMDGHDPVKDFKLREAVPIQHQQLLAWEKELLSIYLTAHPLERISEKLKAAGATPTSALNEEWAGQKITIGGRLVEARRITTKKGDLMAAAIVEDMYGQIEVTAFPRTYADTAELWQDDNVLLITGKVDTRNDRLSIIVDSAELFEVSEEEMNRPKYLLRITVSRTGNDTVDTIHVQDAYRAIERYSGGDQYEVIVRNGSWLARLVPEDNHVGYCAELHQKLEEALGPGSVQVSALVEQEPALAGD